LGHHRDTLQEAFTQQAQEGIFQLSDCTDAPRPPNDNRRPVCTQHLVALQGMGNAPAACFVDPSEATGQHHRVLYGLACALTEEKTLEKVARYEAQLSRGPYKALHELEALQARRTGGAAPLARLDVDGLPGN
jgi:hypothetical protein